MMWVCVVGVAGAVLAEALASIGAWGITDGFDWGLTAAMLTGVLGGGGLREAEKRR